MPANLPPVYHEAEARYKSAKTVEDKIAGLEEMLRLIPKHKGTDKLQGNLKARLAKLRRQPKKKGGSHAFSRHMPKQGAGQVALVGPPNSGKSSLVGRLTHAKPEVADYPFTTREPQPGMMPFEDIAIQLVDLPPLSDEHVEPWVYDLIRAADILWVVVDEAGSLDGIELAERLLSTRHIGMVPPGSEPPEDRGIGWAYKPGLIVVTGCDRAESEDNLSILTELLETACPVLPVSSVDGRGMERLGRRTFDALEIIRVFTKQPGKPADREQPFTLPRGATVADLARTIHKDLSEQLRFARIWGAHVFDGQTVQREHGLDDGDVIELHI